MEINFSINGRHFSLAIGHITPWFQQLNFITFTEIWLSDSQDVKVKFAKLLVKLF